MVDESIESGSTQFQGRATSLEQEKAEKMRLQSKLKELENANRLQENFIVELGKKNIALEFLTKTPRPMEFGNVGGVEPHD